MTKLERGGVTRIAGGWDTAASSSAIIGIAARALAASPSPVLGVTVQNDPDSTEAIFVGDSFNQDFQLTPGSSIHIPVNDLSLVYVRSGGGTPIVNWVAASLGSSPLTTAYTDKVLSYGPIAYWPLNETAGATANCLVNPAQDGTYTGATIGQTVTDANGVSFVCPLFDGINDYMDNWSAALQSVYNPDLLTLCIWARVYNAAVWSDAQGRIFFQCGVDAPGNNRQFMQKNDTNNEISLQDVAGGTYVPRTDSSAGTDWIHWALTVDRGADEFKAYRNGIQISTTANGLGVFVGNITETYTNVGAYNETPINAWYGWLSNAVIFDSALSQPAIADLATYGT